MVTIPDAEIDAIPSVETPTTFSVLVLTFAVDTPEIPVRDEPSPTKLVAVMIPVLILPKVVAVRVPVTVAPDDVVSNFFILL